jgi:hypothetical protein
MRSKFNKIATIRLFESRIDIICAFTWTIRKAQFITVSTSTKFVCVSHRLYITEVGSQIALNNCSISSDVASYFWKLGKVEFVAAGAKVIDDACG